MIEVIHFLKELGNTAVDLFWLPIALWTAFALLTAIAMKIYSKLSAVYYYHISIAVLAALPIGLFATPMIHSLWQTESGMTAPTLFIIQNPITVAAAATTQHGINWLAPGLWIGIATLLAAVVAAIAIIKLINNYVQLRGFTQQLEARHEQFKTEYPNTQVLFSDTIQTPCTFGWLKKIIVLPKKLKNNPEKYQMALHHEWAHIQNNDYIINSIIQCIKALFFFHPLVHYFSRQTDEYREIWCDISVLTNANISHKKYATFLYELAAKPLFNNQATVKMAVHPSTLKKRIKMMKTQSNINHSFKQSITLTLLLCVTLIGFMACSDMTDNGVSKQEVQQLEAETDPLNSNRPPLLIINDQPVLNAGSESIIDKLNPDNIHSIQVLKGKKAVEEYGKAGKKGVIIIETKEPVANLLGINPHVTAKMPELKNKPAFYTGMEYPEQCKQAGVSGTVYVSFTVTQTGAIQNAEVVKGIGPECNQYALNYIKSNADFSPGIKNGKPVSTKLTLPIRFSL